MSSTTAVFVLWLIDLSVTFLLLHMKYQNKNTTASFATDIDQNMLKWQKCRPILRNRTICEITLYKLFGRIAQL